LEGIERQDRRGIGKGAIGTLFVDAKQVAQGRIPQTVAARFSLDESFDVGEDTGTPVVEDYVDKMSYSFTGTLKKFVVVSNRKSSPKKKGNIFVRRKQRLSWPCNEVSDNLLRVRMGVWAGIELQAANWPVP
jgi:hypothetical protein